MDVLNLQVVLYLMGILLCISAHKHMKWKDSYDYIIVGGGTAGSVVAARLSEEENVSVVVLEAGGEATDPFIRIPGTWTSVYTNPVLDWGYVTEPQKMSPMNITIPVSQGKLLGGCGSHNAQFYIRGSPHIYDVWQEMGNANWSYNDVLPYFKKSEMMQDPDLAVNGYHGTDGFMKTRILKDVPIVEEFIKAGIELGFEELNDINGPTIKGIGRLQTNVNEKGERSSTYEAFLKPVRCRRNLDVVTHAHVTKVSFDNDGYPVANGVYFVKDNQTYFIKASREVIVCSGAIGSPTVLMHSGIGRRQHLGSLGIEVISDLPVGDNLQEHLYTPAQFYLSENTPIAIDNRFTFEAMFDQVFTGKGPWSGESAAFMFGRSATQANAEFFPNLEYIFMLPLMSLPDELTENVRKGKMLTKQLVDELVNSTMGPIPVSVYLLHLQSRYRGTVKLRSSDPMENPKITYDFFSNYDDVKDMIEAIRNVQKFVNTSVMQDARAQPIIYDDPNCYGHVFDSDSYLECYIYNNFISGIHFASTCKMAPDDTGVVDDRLRVKGVNRLRVADSSIMPIVTAGHTASPTIMIAEKAADMIKMDMVNIPDVIPTAGCLSTNMVGLITPFALIVFL